jgi:hypothetical protein
MIKYNVPQEFIDTIKALGSTIQTNDSDWIYLPHWMRIDGNGTVEFVSFEHLPEEVRSAIKEKKNP